MDPLDKRVSTTICAVAICLAIFVLMKALFVSSVREVREGMERTQNLLAQHQELLSRKKDLESQWESQKQHFVSNLSSEEIQNQWMKDLLSYGQSQALVMDKLEPGGVKDKDARVFLSFHGEIRKLTAFLYHLSQNDPLSKLESLWIRQEEPNQFSYEIILSKGVS